MISSDDDINNLDSIGPLLSKMDKGMPYIVPKDYFEKIIHSLHIPLLTREQRYDYPVGYFDSFPERLMKAIYTLEDQEDVESSILKSLKGNNVFKVPAGYFESFPTNQLAPHHPKAIVRPLYHRRQIWKQAVAAIITGVIAINALWIFNRSNDDDGLIRSTDEVFSSSVQVSKKYKSQQQIDDGISKLSNEEIIKYLSVNGTDMDNESIISNMGENDLPEQDPNLSDEKSIKNFLNQ